MGRAVPFRSFSMETYNRNVYKYVRVIHCAYCLVGHRASRIGTGELVIMLVHTLLTALLLPMLWPRLCQAVTIPELQKHKKFLLRALDLEKEPVSHGRLPVPVFVQGLYDAYEHLGLEKSWTAGQDIHAIPSETGEWSRADGHWWVRKVSTLGVMLDMGSANKRRYCVAPSLMRQAHTQNELCIIATTAILALKLISR